MTSIGELFPKCRKLVYDARQLAAQGQSTEALLQELDRQLHWMKEHLLYREPQRAVWERKLQELRDEAAAIPTTTTSYANHRQELLLRRRPQSSSNDDDIRHLAREHASLQQSETMVHSLLDQGTASLTGLQAQRQQMRGVRQVMQNIDQSLGLTQSTMRIIERRDVTDAYFVAGGMVFTMFVIYFVWF